MRANRKKYLDAFLKNMKGRDAKDIQMMRMTIRQQDWEEGYVYAALEAYNGDDKENFEKAIRKNFSSTWKDIKKVLKAWYNKPSKATTWKKSAYKDNGKIVVINIKNISVRSKKWYNNAIVNMKKPLNTWAGKNSNIKKIIAEHGKQLERSQQAGGQLVLPNTGSTVNRPGSAGNNMQTSLVKAMKDVIENDSWWCDFMVMQVQNYLHAKINSRVDRRKTKNSIHRNHIIETIISPAPPSRQSGQPDRDDKEEFRVYFNNVFYAEVRKEIARMKAGKVDRKKIAQFAADSPDIFDDFSEFGYDKSVEIAEQEALRAMRKANAQMSGVGPKTKTKVSFKKQLENIRAEKKIGKVIEVARKDATKAKTKTVAKQKAKPPMSKIAPNKRTQVMMDAGFRMDKEGLLIRDLINRILPRAIEANMGSPRLNNQTGRFARSAKVDNVIVGPRGGLYIGYTYPQNPYGVFEPGHGKAPWANQYRDPRHLIGMSIRQIVATNMGGQLVSGLTREFE